MREHAAGSWDDAAVDDQAAPPVRVPTDHDVNGKPTEFITADADAAWQWDDRRWQRLA